MNQVIHIKKERIAKHVIQFSDCMGYRANLVLGTQKAALIDTMCGVGNLRAEVESVTNLPVTVLLTHSHFDHIGGAFLYEKAWLSLPEQNHVNSEIPHLEMVYQKILNDGIADPSDTLAPLSGKTISFMTLSEGTVFDLGGVTLRAVALPGHTNASMGFISAEDSLLFTGDAATPIMCLFFENSLPIDGYLETLGKMRKLPFSYFITSHHSKLFPKKSIEDFIDCARFAKTDRGMKFQHDILPEYKGTLHIYRGNSSENDDFLALIDRSPCHRIYDKTKRKTAITID